MTAYRPAHLSVSSVELYIRCPAAYKARYVDKRVEPTSAPMLTGTAFHSALEAGHRGQDAERAWMTAANTTEATLALSGKSMTMSKAHGLALLDGYERRGYAVRGEPEVRFSLPFPNGAIPVPILGFMDAVLPDEVREYKTTRSPSWWTESRAATAYQTAVYGWAHTRLRHRRVPIRYLIFGTNAPTIDEYVVEYSPEMFRVFEQVAELSWNGIAAREFAGCGLSRCATCAAPVVEKIAEGPSIAMDD